MAEIQSLCEVLIYAIPATNLQHSTTKLYDAYSPI